MVSFYWDVPCSVLEGKTQEHRMSRLIDLLMHVIMSTIEPQLGGWVITPLQFTSISSHIVGRLHMKSLIKRHAYFVLLCICS